MPNSYFSDREQGAPARIKEEILPSVWGGIASAVQTAVADGSLGLDFPDVCPDGGGPIGTNFHNMFPALVAEVPGIDWPLVLNNPPPVYSILDLIEFVHKHIGKPTQGSYHSFFNHHHLDYDRGEGQTEFRERINTIFARNGVAFELHAVPSRTSAGRARGESTGEIRRLGPPIVRETLRSTAFSTSDKELNAMLETARTKFLDTNPTVRREAVEKLWDAWERLKTILPGLDKKSGIKALLDNASPEPNLRAVLEEEAGKLTCIGNSFKIRHSETTQTPLQHDSQVDYLFHRLFALIWLLLRPPPANNKT
jgi:hypothetical protein